MLSKNKNRSIPRGSTHAFQHALARHAELVLPHIGLQRRARTCHRPIEATQIAIRRLLPTHDPHQQSRTRPHAAHKPSAGFTACLIPLYRLICRFYVNLRKVQRIWQGIVRLRQARVQCEVV